MAHKLVRMTCIYLKIRLLPARLHLSGNINCLIVTFTLPLPMKKYRTVIRYKEYFDDFLRAQRPKVVEKIIQTLRMIEVLERIPATYLKHIEGSDGLFEIRVQFASDIFRVFCFFDDGKLVVLLSGFQKKTQKTPQAEIKRAESLMAEYYEEKRKETQHGH